MKIQKLKIHNIASIEDATVDFTGEPLSGSDVFLITGKTGAGKSTILDAVSLALYNTTPRLESAPDSRVENNSDNLTLRDPRQLMRRETGEAWVELMFEGIDGKQYEARWAVQRGKLKKVTVSMDNVAWSVRCISDGSAPVMGSNTRTYPEVREAVVKAVGLEFDQFCRTTMLAQGEFTRFLKSPEDKKSEILAKITQFTDYARIGKKIYEIDAQKKAIRDKAAEAAGDTGMPPEKVREMEESLSVLYTRLRDAESLRSAAMSKKSWLEACRQSDAKKDEVAMQKEALESEVLMLMKKDVDEWEVSSEARRLLGVRVSELENIRKQDSLLDGCRQQYRMLMGAADVLQSTIDANSARLVAVRTYLAQNSGKAELYSNAKVIAERLVRIDKAWEEIRTADSELNAVSERIAGGLKDALEAAEKARDDARAAVSALSSMQELLAAKNDVAKYLGAVKVRGEEVMALASLQEDIDRLSSDLEGMNVQLLAQQSKVDASRKAYDRLKDTVDEWAKSMRSKLSSGELDVCPVCGQRVLDVTFSEEKLSLVYDLAKSEYDAAQKEFESIRNSIASILTRKDGMELSLAERRRRLEIDSSVEDAMRIAEQTCTGLNLNLSDSGLGESLDVMLNVQKSRLAFLGFSAPGAEDTVQEARYVALMRRELETDITDVLEPALAAAKENLDAATRRRGELESRKDTLEKAAGSEAASVSHFIPSELWSDAPGKYADSVLLPEAAIYEKALKLQDELSQDGTPLILSNLGATMERIDQMEPEWRNDAHVAGLSADDACSYAANLYADIKAAESGKSRAMEIVRSAEDTVRNFVADHPSISYSRMLALEAMADIDVKRDIVKNEQERMVRLENELDLLKTQLDRLEKPELGEDDTPEKLNATIEEADSTTIPSLNREIGVMQKALEDDLRKKEEAAELEKVRDAAQKDYDEWNVIARELGDAEGRKFQRIAQSFILGNLIHSANGYLKDRKLAERYTLKAVPNTLHLSIEDAYQGFATRSTDSLSGGESFLVSLALAMALSDIGDGLAVDTLFIDEGFGTLSGEPLAKAINVLRNLHNSNGRHIGIISHIDEVKANIPVQIQVNQEGSSSCSTVRVTVDR